MEDPEKFDSTRDLFPLDLAPYASRQSRQDVRLQQAPRCPSPTRLPLYVLPPSLSAHSASAQRGVDKIRCVRGASASQHSCAERTAGHASNCTDYSYAFARSSSLGVLVLMHSERLPRVEGPTSRGRAETRDTDPLYAHDTDNALEPAISAQIMYVPLYVGPPCHPRPPPPRHATR